jgi:hypothetical protein
VVIREPAVAGMTTGELERARRDLTVSLALAREGSAVRVPIVRQITAIDAELARRAGSTPPRGSPPGGQS